MSISRRQFIETLAGSAVVGNAAFLEACKGLSPEEIEKLPSATVEELIKNPQKYANADNL